MNFKPKSRTVSLVLTIFFGPLGLFYSSVIGGLILTVLAILSAPSIIGPVVCWVFAIAFGDHFTHRHNQNIAKLSEFVRSTRP